MVRFLEACTRGGSLSHLEVLFDVLEAALVFALFALLRRWAR